MEQRKSPAHADPARGVARHAWALRAGCAALACAAAAGTAAVAGLPAESALGTDASQDALVDASAYAAAQVASEKDETVNVTAAPDGTPSSTIVSVELTNAEGASALRDQSSLSEIAATDGRSSFVQTSEGIVWNANGKDVSYQGTAGTDLPVGVEVSYYLNDEAIDPADLAGKSGHVKIRFDYRNDSTAQTSVGEVSTPFVAITGLSLDNDIFENVQVENGRVVDAGDASIVVGYAVPGLQESLDIDAGDLELPDYLQIEADVEGFELDSTATIFSSNVFDDVDASDIDTSELGDALDSLSSAMTQLIDGSGSLTDGLSQVSSGAESLSSGVEKYVAGASQASSLASALQQGLAAGASEKETAAQQAEAAVTAAQAAVATAQNAYDAAAATAKATPNGDNVAAMDTAAQALSQAQEALADAQLAAGEARGAADAAAADASNAYLTQLVGALSALGQNGEDLTEGAAGLSSGASTVAAGSSQLTESLSQFNAQGIQQLLSAYQESVVGTKNRVQAISDAGEAYTNFSGIADGTAGTVKFIIETDAVKTGE